MAEQKKNLLYLGKVLRKDIQTKEGNTVTVDKLLADNPLPTKKDGSVDPYHKGQLIYRTKDGEEFLLKSATFRGVSDKAGSFGFIKSLAVDLDDTYSVQKLNK